MRSSAQLLVQCRQPLAAVTSMVGSDVFDWPVYLVPEWFPWRLLANATGITLPWGIYIRADALAWPPADLARLIVHELVHVAQWRDFGVVRFGARYVGEYLAARLRGRPHGQAYTQISFEVEASRHAAQILG